MVTLGRQDGEVANMIARVLLRQRIASGRTLQQLADETGWGMQTVRRYLGGERVMPVDAFYLLSRAMRIDPVDVLLEVQERLGERASRAVAEKPEQLEQRVVFESAGIRITVEPLSS